MPKFNHPNLGDVCKSAYLPGRILRVYHAVAANDSQTWDCADVLEIGSHTEYHRCPIIYHCERAAQLRPNGAVENGARGFVEGDDVILLCKLTDGARGDSAPASAVYVFGHIGGPRKCAYNYVLVRVAKSELAPLSLPLVEADHRDEFCTIFDVDSGEVADIRMPSNPSQKYVFPCRVNDVKPILDLCEVHGINLFEFGPQGDPSYRMAGGTPSWLSDGNGADLRVGPNFEPNLNNWYNYDPCFQLFDDLRVANMLDFTGTRNGSFDRTSAIWQAKESTYDEWNSRSNGVLKAVLDAGCAGGSFNNTPAAVDEDSQRAIQVLTNEMASIRVSISGYEQEIRDLAAQLEQLEASYTQSTGELADTERRLGEEGSTLQNIGLIRVLLARRAELMSLIDSITLQKGDISVRIDALNVRISSCYDEINLRNSRIRAILAGDAAPGAWGYAMDAEGRELFAKSLHAQVAYGEAEIYACTPPAMSDGKGNITTLYGCDTKSKFVRLSFVPAALGAIQWYVGILKMVREGCYNRTTCPAVKDPGKFFGVGSYRLKTTQIPGDTSYVEQFSALNTRIEYIDTWERYDNWNNSLSASYASLGVDRTWWFRSYAQQWRYRIVFVDTPLGSMFCAAPHIQVALWYVLQLYLSSGVNTARQDWPLNNDFHRIAKHSANVICQVYVVQRQGVTLWNQHNTPADYFVTQHAGWGPYDCHYWQNVVPDPVAEDGKPSLPAPNDPVAYLKSAGQVVGHVSEADNLTPYMSNRSYVRSYRDGEAHTELGPLTTSMHEVEVMASADLYNTLQARFGRKHPNDQVRNPALEEAIENLIRYYYTTIGAPSTELQYFNIDVEVL